MAKEIWFRDSGGEEKCCNEGSVAHNLMSNDGSFVRIDGPGGKEQKAPASENSKQDLSTMKKAELLAYAESKGIEVNPKATVKAILAVIEESNNEAADE